MPQPTPSRPEIWSASLLRRDLSARAHHLARTQNLLHDISPGSEPIVIFGRDEQGRHGNFHPASDATICANPAWLRRLTKPHTASRRSRARNDWQWMELDSANSSDALLMNIFCHPRVFNGHTLAPAVANLLNIDPATHLCFGINPGVPLKTIRKRHKANQPAKNPGAPEPALSSSKGLDSETWVLEAPTTSPRTATDQTLTDRTEIDLQLGNLFLEAKLTESNFQTAAPRLIERYRDLEIIFDLTRLPQKPTGAIQGYQLIRNVLAAYASDAGFCVLSDTRRRDLIEIWYSVLSAVHSHTFATRLKLLTWQELATTLPQDLQQFLDEKYGIVPANRHYSRKTSGVHG
ncbi:MAG TPA: hypothetical protein VNX17_11010 [Edaphobacter sp.]|nr:hypothetical protein [Edaphobacter sp.]